jgi:iron complex outermembrane receptor protein
MKLNLLRTTAMVGGALMAVAPAFAQEAAPASPAPAGEVIVVTGSLIARQDFDADSPIVTVDADAISAQGPGTIEATLNQMPQFTALRPGSSFSDGGRGGRNNANMRGLGIARTLVLLDGRRMQPSDSLGAIDLNTLPTQMIESVEVITGGASAAYGSDAIAGVVNFKLKRNFEGLMIDGQYGVTGEGDSGSAETFITAGGDFAEGRGNAVLSLSYLNREFSPRKNRDFFMNSSIAGNLAGGIFQPDAQNLWSQAALNQLFITQYGEARAPTRSQGLGINADGSLFTPSSPILNYQYADHDPYVLVNGRVGTAYGEDLPLQTPLERYSAFARVTYEISDTLEVFSQLHHVDYETAFSRPGYSSRELRIPLSNPFIPNDLRTVLASRPQPNAPIIYHLSTAKFGTDDYVNEYGVDQYTVGASGAAPFDWTWDAYASYGKTSARERSSLRVDRTAINTLLGAADGGQSICAGGYNAFTPAPVSADCTDYLLRSVLTETEFTQQSVQATLQGGLFKLPAGDLQFAVGAGYRRNAYDYRPDEQLINGTLIDYPAGQVDAVNASDDVSELFVELLVPVLSDLPLAKDVSLNLGYRLSDYDSIDSVSTYKATGDWAMFDWLRFRGGYQRAIRAPSLGELYPNPGGGQGLIQSTASGNGDPCDVNGVLRSAANPNAARVRDLCIASGVPLSVIDIFQFSGSAVSVRTPFSTALHEETADTYTVGAVLRPDFELPTLRNLQLSLDYYSIEIADAVGFITGPIVLNECFNRNGSSNPDYSASNPSCQLVLRDDGGSISEILTPQLNLGAYNTAGIDLQIDGSFDLSDIGVPVGYGEIDLNFVLSYLDRYEIQNLAGQPFTDYAGTIGNAQIDPYTISFPEWKATASATYAIGSGSVTLASRWFDSLYHYQDAGAATRTRAGVASRIYFDLTGKVDLPFDMQLRGGVLNVADTQPPEWTGEGATDPALFDILGRRFFIGVNKMF